MSKKKNFAFRLKSDDFKEIQFNESLQNLVNVYVLCKYSFNNNPNVDINKLVLNKYSQNEINNLLANEIKTNFSFNDIMKFKNQNIDFYIVDSERLKVIFKNNNIINKCQSSICYENNKGRNILLFINETKIISFNVKNNPSINNNIININNNQMLINQNNNNFININNNNNFPYTDYNNAMNMNNVVNQRKKNNNINSNSSSIDNITKIIQGLILLYGNEKEIIRLYSNGISNVKDCYLINKDWINKLKEIYHYNGICNILALKGIQTYKDCYQNLNNYNLLNEIKSKYNNFNIDTSALSQIDYNPQNQYFDEYIVPTNFVIIHKAVLNLLILNNYLSNEYNICFAISTLYLRKQNDGTKIYVYNYNNFFHLIGIIDTFADVWKSLYDRHLSKMIFSLFLAEKNIDENLKNQKQNLISTGQKHLGYIYIPAQESNEGIINNEIMNINTNKAPVILNNTIKKNINENKNNAFISICDKLTKALNTLKYNNYDMDIQTLDIREYFNLGILEYLKVFIIENTILKYCIDYISKNGGQMNDFSYLLSEDKIISPDKIQESNNYSFINEELCKYFKFQNINNLPKVYLFINKRGNNKKEIFIFYPNQNSLLKVYNYHNNKFNIKKLSKDNSDSNNINNMNNIGNFDNFTNIDNNDNFNNQYENNDIIQDPIIPPEPPFTQENHTGGLENIGATCYMNATLQCLCHIDSIKKYYQNDNIFNQMNPGTLSKCFGTVLRTLWNVKSYAPREFKNKISIMNPLFQGIQANDSKDLVLFIYETIHGELNNPNQNPEQININNIPNELVQFRQNYYSQNYSIISKTFYYEQSNVMECQNCHYKTNNFNIMNIIIFPLEKVRQYMEKRKPNGFTVVTLNDCFEQNEEHEILSGSNQIYCNSCHQNANASSYTQLYTCPEVLTIILNRGKGLEFDVNFSFPMNLTLDKYVQDKSFDPNYELIGVLTHYGPSGMAGHFVAYCKSPINGQWFFYNDAEVTPCNSNVESEMQSNGIPYILFYQRRKINYNSNNNFEKPKCIYFTYEGKEGYFEYTDDYKMLSDAYNEFCNKYEWAPKGGHILSLMKNNNMINLNEYASLAENGINDGDRICIIMN